MPVATPNDPQNRTLPDPGSVNWGPSFNDTLISVVQQLNSFEQQYQNEQPPTGSDFDALQSVVEALENFYPMPPGIEDTIGSSAVDLQYQRSSTSNVAAGVASFAVGANNTADGAYTSVVGYENEANGLASSVCGEQNTAHGRTSCAAGHSASARESASQALGQRGFGPGFSQRVELVRNLETDTNEWQVVTGPVGYGEAVTITPSSNGTAGAVKIRATAVGVSSAGIAHVVEFDAVAVTGDVFSLPVVDKTVRQDSDNASWDVRLQGTSEGINVEAKGLGGVRWTVFCEYVESHAA
jgi:hypothetical protein